MADSAKESSNCKSECLGVYLLVDWFHSTGSKMIQGFKTGLLSKKEKSSNAALFKMSFYNNFITSIPKVISHRGVSRVCVG